MSVFKEMTSIKHLQDQSRNHLERQALDKTRNTAKRNRMRGMWGIERMF